MKYMVMTEGTCEKAILDVLLEKGMLKISQQDLVYEEIFHCRQFGNEEIDKINSIPKNEEIICIRVGDKLSDKLKIHKDIERSIINIYDFCTKPELEILYIIDKGLFDDYNKYKSNYNASSYLKKKDKSYRKSYEYHYEYFSNKSVDEIYNLLKEYNKKRGKTHNKNEFTLLDLCK